MNDEVKKTATSRREPPEELAQELETLGSEAGSYEFQPLSAMRRAIARRTTESFRDIPHFSLLAKVEVDALSSRRHAFNRETSARTSLNDWIIKAAALALQRAPAANASFTAKGLIFHRHSDIAVAVATESGLVTPIVRRAEQKSLEEISAEMRELAKRAREKRLAHTEYTGGTFSISNLGMFGVTSFSSVLNPPQGCILSVGEAAKQHVFRDDEACVASVMQVTLTCDHRVVDGAIGAGWLQQFRQLIEQPQSWAEGLG